MPARNTRAGQRKFRIKTIPSPLTHQPAPQSSRDLTLAFISVDNPGLTKDKAAQSKIRRHVMLNIGKSRRKQPDSHPPPTLDRPPYSLTLLSPSHWGEVNICPNFKRLFKAMDVVSQGALAIVVDDAIRSPPVTSDGHRHFHSHREMALYTDSLGLIRKHMIPAINPPNLYAIIGTVICLAYFDLRTLNFDGWKTHMQGLENITELYGGVDALELHQPLRQSLFLYDPSRCLNWSSSWLTK
jgi:hypothetical protein